jgi:hypothetical protein
MGEDGVQGPIALQQAAGPLVSDAVYSGDIVRAVPHQGEIVHHLSRGDTQPFGRIRFIDPQFFHPGRPATSGIEKGNPGTDELVEVLVT